VVDHGFVDLGRSGRTVAGECAAAIPFLVGGRDGVGGGPGDREGGVGELEFDGTAGQLVGAAHRGGIELREVLDGASARVCRGHVVAKRAVEGACRGMGAPGVASDSIVVLGSRGPPIDGVAGGALSG